MSVVRIRATGVLRIAAWLAVFALALALYAALGGGR